MSLSGLADLVEEMSIAPDSTEIRKAYAIRDRFDARLAVAVGEFEAAGAYALDGDLTMQAQEHRGPRPASESPAVDDEQAAGVIGKGIAVGIQHDHPCLRPQSGEGIGVVAQSVGATERFVAEGEAGEFQREFEAGICHCVHMIRGGRRGPTC